jgi:hypothetical protein
MDRVAAAQAMKTTGRLSVAESYTHPLTKLAPELEDGCLIHAAVLARRLNVLLLPRQVLLAGTSVQDIGRVSFVHGIPQATTAAGATHARDKRLRRYLLNLSKLPIVPGITFSSRGVRSLHRFVARTGYPLTLTRAIGENPSRRSVIKNEAELSAAVSAMQEVPDDQLLPASSLEASAYGENILSFSRDDTGRRLAPVSSRLVVEKKVSGRYVRCLVCGNDVLAAVEFERSASTPRSDISDQLHPGFKIVAMRAAAVVPGLFAASVDLVVQDPAKDPELQTYYITEISERLRLDTYMDAAVDLGPTLADMLLIRQAEKSALILEDPAEEIAIHVKLEGLVEPHELLPLFRESCNALGLSGFLRLVESKDNIVEGHIQGRPDFIAVLMEALLSGLHFGQRISAADEWQTGLQSHTSFTIA